MSKDYDEDLTEELSEDIEEELPQEEPQKKKGFFRRLREGMSKTRNSIASGLNSIFHGFSKIDEDFYEELEEVLIMADIGVATTGEILDNLRAKVKELRIKEPEACRELLMESIREQMEVPADAYDFEKGPSAVLVVGVNGVGKTTTTGKIAWLLKNDGRKVLMAAADTFRAAATEQLVEWSHRAGCDIIAAKEGADPAAVVFDAVSAAKARKADVLICDTAGRLHNKKNLMDELGKINRVIDREYPDAKRETLVVLDGTTGQNALAQAKQFNEICNITGIVITKLDGTAKGGIAIAIQKELGIPVKYIGVGEGVLDLQKFDPEAYVRALFDVADKDE
ncbi:MAG: signal recognition particle-docking protein FtsY [Lachnospiraceae bacterium]|nr:signal recognition particle-docking protein FtsY [Lachnospiraceae bacterium]